MPSVTASIERPNSGQLGVLRGASLATAVGAFVQLLLGGYQFTAHSAAIGTAHNVIGLVTLGFGVIATIAAFVNKSHGGNPGLAFHVAGTTVLILLQYILGAAHTLVLVHMIVGVVIIISAIGMATLAFRRPLARQ